MDYLIGTDPELFVIEGNEFRSGHDLIPGTKEVPHFVKRGAVQVDGVALEFNTFPASSEDEFVSNINSVRGSLTRMVKKKAPHLKIVAEPTAMFTEEYFATIPESALILGCTPDFDAYTDEANPKPKTDKPMRTGAGHIHIGWGQLLKGLDHFYECSARTRQMDHSVFLSSLLWDSDDTRRELYGKVGSFRPKIYGFEYRPLSNAFLRSESVIRLVYRQTIHAMKLFDDGVILQDDKVLSEVIESISNGIKLDEEELIDIQCHLNNEYDFDVLIPRRGLMAA